jgi:hypothetical protein
MVVAAAMSEEVLSFDWGTTIIGVLDVNTDIYTPYCGASRIDGVRRIASCCGTAVSFNGNLYDLPQMAKFLGLASAEDLQLRGTHVDMLDITSQARWPGPNTIIGSERLPARYASYCSDIPIPASPVQDGYEAGNWRDCYMAAGLWKKWKLGELRSPS